jgi:signal transduction histidine kinase
VLETVTTVVALSVAALCWVRYRQRRETVALYQTAAFLVLGIANTTMVVLTVTGLDARVGVSLAEPGQAPLYVFTLSRLVVATLLVVGSLGGRRSRVTRHAGTVLVGSAAAGLFIVALLAVPDGTLPALGSIATGSAAANAGGAAVLSLTPLGIGLSLAGAALFAWAAALHRELYRRGGAIGDAYLSVGLVFATFAQIAFAKDPSLNTGLVSSADLMRLAFDVLLLVGIQAQAHSTLADLRSANRDLARLRMVEVERAGQAERVRLSRELHDGLAQNLWLAKLKAGRLASLEGLTPEAAQLTEELDSAIEAGLVEAQQAVAALRLSGEPGSSLPELLSRAIDEFTDRFGLRADFECGDLPAVSPRIQVESLRITQEALTNVRRHADATMVRVTVLVDDGQLVVSVADNGRGFDPGAVGTSAFGLTSMRERAELIGGRLDLVSAPASGTLVRLVAPLRFDAPASVTVVA